ncbi:MAG: ATP12 family protein [Pseudomonadota bacterium]
MKRFWKTALVEKSDAGWAVFLDTRPVKTPAGRAIVTPIPAMAEAISAEWEAQTEFVNPLSMPMTRLAATCLDRVAPELAGVAQTLASYGESDLLCYRADHPDELVARQANGWDPVLDWAAQRFGSRLNVQTGVMHVDQPPDDLQALANEVLTLDAWQMTAMADLVTISGSLLLGLAVREGRLRAADAWALSRIDEQWNIEQWGEDHEAAVQSAKRESDFHDAAKLLGWLTRG